MRKIHKISMRIGHIGLHAAQAEHHIAIAFGGQIFRRIQRFIQRDAETALEQHRHLGLTPDDFQQLEVLRVARADLQHHTGRLPCLVQRLVDFIEMRFMGDFHRHHFDAVFARQLEHIGQTILAVPLKRVRAGARLVSAHAGTHLAVITQGAQHDLNMLFIVHRTQPGKHVQGVLPETHAVIFKMGGTLIVTMTPEYAVLLGNTHHTFYTGQALHIRDVQRLGITDQIDFRNCLFAAALNMHACLYSRHCRQMRQQLLIFLGFFGNIAAQNQNHRYPLKLLNFCP